MKYILILPLVLSMSLSVSAQTEGVELLEHAKNMVCNGDKKCESYFSSSMGISAMISRYHGECMTDNDSSKQCKDAKKTYEYIMSEYEKTK
ncbi:hypothetical protein ABQ431_03580 [Serratia fonticola]|uniref:hypothetical protein n=1 Tax=Serratia fonticola TaxID=47917 RepID=UPI003AAA8722|nr:hypothetical protein [Serratia fonticola]HBE9093224.1 hypothetical protein [Serratia fonticola]